MNENSRREARERRAPDSITMRFFYHSLPPPGDEEPLSEAMIEQGVATLTGIAEIGLLLTPEGTVKLSRIRPF